MLSAYLSTGRQVCDLLWMCLPNSKYHQIGGVATLATTRSGIVRGWRGGFLLTMYHTAVVQACDDLPWSPSSLHLHFLRITTSKPLRILTNVHKPLVHHPLTSRIDRSGKVCKAGRLEQVNHHPEKRLLCSTDLAHIVLAPRYFESIVLVICNCRGTELQTLFLFSRAWLGIERGENRRVPVKVVRTQNGYHMPK